MASPTEIPSLERHLSLTRFEDGVIDVCIGVAVLSVGLLFLTHSPLISLGAALAPFAWRLWHRRVCEPRLGQVEIGPQDRPWERRPTLLVALGILIIAVLGLAFYAWRPANPLVIPDRTLDLGNVGVWIGVAVLALGLTLAGLRYGVDRLVAYGGVLVAAFGISVMLGSPAGSGMVIAGSVIVVVGGSLLLRFLKRYPLVHQA